MIESKPSVKAAIEPEVAKAESHRSSGSNQEVKGKVTQMLERMEGGDSSAANELMPLVYNELRRIARAHMRRERPGHTLQPTALLHEAYCRLAESKAIHCESRTHFFSIAARMMRLILVDYARARGREKRGEGAEHVEFDEARVDQGASTLTVEALLSLDDALNHLAQISKRLVQVVELRYFAGFTNKEVATMLNIAEPTVKRDWSAAQALLAQRLGGSWR